MKRLTAILLTIMMICSLSGCAILATDTDKNNTQTELLETEVTAKATVVSIGSLKGPTSMGLVSMMKNSEDTQQNAKVIYDFTMETDASTLLPMMIKGELDIALLPANVAATLYQKMEGELTVLDINTLGVLYMVSTDDSLTSFEQLKGKTIYLTGKGTTPDYALQYLLKMNGMTTEDVKLEYKSEASEVVALLASETGSIGVLPQPFVTAATTKNQNLKVIFDFNEEWNKTEGSKMVTGVTVVRNEFLQENKEAVEQFLKDHKLSAEFANTNVEECAKLVAEYGIIDNETVAKNALPKCNISCITGAEMKSYLSGYLKVLYDFSADSVGGKLPEDSFYFE